MHMHRFFFILSSADGHLGCFSVLALINSAARNSRVRISLRASVFPDVATGRAGPVQVVHHSTAGIPCSQTSGPARFARTEDAWAVSAPALCFGFCFT